MSREELERANSLAAFLTRADESIGRATIDRFHWNRWRTSLLPAEPEIVSIATLSAIAALTEGAENELEARLTPQLSERGAVPGRDQQPICRMFRAQYRPFALRSLSE
jgi:hypothetical protein